MFLARGADMLPQSGKHATLLSRGHARAPRPRNPPSSPNPVPSPMPYHDRPRDPGFLDSIKRIFSGSEGFYGWSIPFFTVPDWVPGLRNISIRIHLLYILIAGGELVGALQQDSIGLNYVAKMMAVLFALVLLHEFGHCLACRLVGGQADRVLMWPLGGLAFCAPPHRWKPSLITTLGGPGVNAALFPLFAALLVASGADWASVLFNPFRPGPVLAHAYFLGGSWRGWLWAAHYMNLLLLAFNMLLPLYPMDCGRVLQELLWWRLGYKRSMVLSTNLGLLTAVALGVFAITTGQSRLVGIALFGGMTCYSQKQQLAMMADDDPWSYDTDKGYAGFSDADSPPAKPTWSQRRAAKAAEKQARAQEALNAELDRILAKIRTQGMASLTPKEKATLVSASKNARDR